MKEFRDPHPDLPAPSTSVGLLGWLRGNLFSSVGNSLLTIFACYIIYLLIVPAFDWALLNADWVGETRNDCTSGGACWVFVGARFDQFMYGFYPESEYWRINLAFGLLAVLGTGVSSLVTRLVIRPQLDPALLNGWLANWPPANGSR